MNASERLNSLRATASLNVGRAIMLALLTAFLMSVAAALTKKLVPVVAIEWVLLAQYLVCLFLMFPWLIKRGASALKTDHFGLHLVRSASGWLCMYAYFIAIKNIPLVDAVLLRNAAPLCVPIWVLLWLKVRIPMIRWLPVIVGFAGVALILQPEGEGLKLWHFIGLSSAFMLAASIVTTRVLTTSEPTSRILFYYFLFSSFFTLPIALQAGGEVPLSVIPLMVLVGLLTFFSMWSYTGAYQQASSIIVSPISYFGVVFAGFWGWLFWEQLPDGLALGGALLVITGGISSVWLGSKATN